jgi:phage terminase large subunit
MDPAKRWGVNEGGTSSSKTFSILQLLIDISQRRTKPLLTSVVSESLPHLKLGCIRDFRQIMGNDYQESRWNATQNVYTFGAAQLEFFSADQPGKARGPRRDILFLNEVNNIPKPIVDELDMRTRRFVFADFNPVEHFWLHDLQGRPEVAWTHSTYLDARHVLPKAVVDKIEAKRDLDPNWWNVYGLGKVGNIEGLVHPKFSVTEDMPDPVDGVEIYGLDFGYTNDPTVLTRNIIIGDDLYSDELIYETGLTNQNIATRMQQCGLRKWYDEIYADAAEPKSIDEIALFGFNIKPAKKGADSIVNGIQHVNSFRQHWTKRSVNCIKEQRNYRYITDKNGKFTNKPMDSWNHGLDSRRYAIAARNDVNVPLMHT